MAGVSDICPGCGSLLPSHVFGCLIGHYAERATEIEAARRIEEQRRQFDDARAEGAHLRLLGWS